RRAASLSDAGRMPQLAIVVNLATTQFAADVPAGGAVDVNLGIAHAGAAPVHARKVACGVDPPVACIASDGEQFGERQLLVAVKDLEPLDLGERFIPRP